MNEYIDFHLFSIAGTTVTVGTLAIAFLVSILTLIIGRTAQRGTEAALRVKGMRSAGAASVTSRLVQYLVLAIGFGFALKTIGIDLGALFTAGALFAVAIGFATQNLTQNFVSGLILMVERTIKPGDILEVESEIVRVEKMGIRSTVARTLDDDEIIIPNSTLVENPIKNLTLRDSLLRLRIMVGVTYSSDMKQVRTVLEKAAADLLRRDGHNSHKPAVRLKNFGDSSVNWEISIWIDNPWSAQQKTSELYETVWFALKEAGITIAFPQLDVHLDTNIEPTLDAIASQ